MSASREVFYLADSATSAATFRGGGPRSRVVIRAHGFVLGTLMVITKGMIIVGAVAFDMHRSVSTKRST